MLKNLLKKLFGTTINTTRPPTKADIILILKQLRFPHGHLALSSLLYLTEGERTRINELTAWLDKHREKTDELLREIADERQDKAERLRTRVQEIRPDIQWPTQES